MLTNQIQKLEIKARDVFHHYIHTVHTSTYIYTHIHTHTHHILYTTILYPPQRLKTTTDIVPNLLAQISAYQENYFHVESLIDDSRTKSEALMNVEQTKAQMNEV